MIVSIFMHMHKTKDISIKNYLKINLKARNSLTAFVFDTAALIIPNWLKPAKY